MTADNVVDAFEQFRAFLVERDSSPKTIKHYLGDLNLFKTWFEATGETFDPTQVVASDIQRYRDHLQRLGRRPATINRHLVSIKLFFSWCIEADLLVKSPAKRIKLIPEQKKTPREMSDRDEARLLRAIEKDGTLKDYTLVLFMLQTGLRASEAGNVRWKDVTINERSGEVRVVSGKRKKYRLVPLTSVVRSALTEYRHWLKWQRIESEFVFFGRTADEPYSNRALGDLLKKFARMAEIDHVKPHDLRHRFAYVSRKSGMQLVDLQTILGHDSINTTAIYGMSTQEDLREAMENVARKREVA